MAEKPDPIKLWRLSQRIALPLLERAEELVDDERYIQGWEQRRGVIGAQMAFEGHPRPLRVRIPPPRFKTKTGVSYRHESPTHVHHGGNYDEGEWACYFKVMSEEERWRLSGAGKPVTDV